MRKTGNYLILISTIFLLTSFLAGGSLENIPYDWINQYGRATWNGSALSNFDITSGPLIFDQAIGIYPHRLGSLVESRTVILSGSALPDFSAPPDTGVITSKFFYQKGDYNLDQLDVEFKSSDQYSYLELNGFKRSYSGHLGQYQHSSGLTVPAQQSYRIDYRSRNSAERDLEFSLGHFISESGLLDSNSLGYYQEKITSSGLQYRKAFGPIRGEFHLGEMLQHCRSKSPVRDTTFTQEIIRNRAFGRLEIPILEGIVFLTASANQQAAPEIRRYWYDFIGGFTTGKINFITGISIIDASASPKLSLSFDQPIKNGQIGLILARSSERINIAFLDKTTDKSEQWFNVGLSASSILKKIEFRVNSHRYQVGNYHEFVLESGSDTYSVISQSGYLWNSQFGFAAHLMDDLVFSINYAHNEYDLVTLSNGIRDHLKINLEGKLDFILRDRLDLFFNLEIQGWLNRDSRLRHDQFQNILYINNQNGDNLSNVWPVNLELRAVVSSVTIYYKINNLLYELAPLFTNSSNAQSYQIISELSFPSQPSQVSFGVEWNFRN